MHTEFDDYRSMANPAEVSLNGISLEMIKENVDVEIRDFDKT